MQYFHSRSNRILMAFSFTTFLNKVRMNTIPLNMFSPSWPFPLIIDVAVCVIMSDAIYLFLGSFDGISQTFLKVMLTHKYSNYKRMITIIQI